MDNINSWKVVLPDEMARVEKLAIAGGCSEEKFMLEAGEKIADAIFEWMGEKRKVCLVVGKGSNGGDAYAAGSILLGEGYSVRAISLFSEKEESALHRKMRLAFLKKKGKVERGSFDFRGDDLIVDGIFGTGFKGAVDGIAKEAIEAINASGKLVLAIDIPSGLDGASGQVRGCAIKADLTVALGLPKMGFFLREGWNQVGILRVENFGLPERFIEKAASEAELLDWGSLRLPQIVRKRHKYEAGYVVGFGGSKEMPGAARLCAKAVLRAGARIVRLFSKDEIQASDEVISNMWDEAKWKKELARAQAVFVGPGLGSFSKEFLGARFKEIKQSCVIDADALVASYFPKGAILTPHLGEALRLLGLKTAPTESILFEKLRKFSKQKGVVVVLKGAPTIVFGPGEAPLIIPLGDPGMATAGTGDVLTGVIAALLAQKMKPYEAAVLGVSLHALAGEIAAMEKTSYCLIAGDLIEHLPGAFGLLHAF